MERCYIASSHKALTHDLGKASHRRFIMGKRSFLIGDGEPLAIMRDGIRTGAIKLSFAQGLYDSIVEDVLSGADGGSYFLDGTSPTYGYSVGGARLENRNAEELILSGEELEDAENVIAAIELMSDEVRAVERDFPGRPCILGWWREFGKVFFDASTWLEDEDEAAELAFKMNNEWAYYDLGNGVTVFLQDYLMNKGKSLDDFVAYKSAAREYRCMTEQDRLMRRHAWFLGRF